MSSKNRSNERHFFRPAINSKANFAIGDFCFYFQNFKFINAVDTNIFSIVNCNNQQSTKTCTSKRWFLVPAVIHRQYSRIPHKILFERHKKNCNNETYVYQSNPAKRTKYSMLFAVLPLCATRIHSIIRSLGLLDFTTYLWDVAKISKWKLTLSWSVS